jgi:DNA-directed RNA polymerase specialized sigma24 family protein
MSAATVNRPLTPNRRPRVRRVVENDEYGAFIRRIITAYSRRVAAGDVEALRDLVNLSDQLDNAIAQAVLGLRAFGYSWADIAARLGITRQAAQQRWGGDKDA